MKFFCISDDEDTSLGLRLAGIEGVVVRSKKDAEDALEFLVKDEEIGIILITKKVLKMCKEKIHKIKLNEKKPLVVVVPSCKED